MERRPGLRFDAGVLCLAVVLAIVADAVAGDVMTMPGKKEVEGTFLYYRNSRLFFKPRQGKTMRESPSAVTELALDPPAKVIVKLMGKKPADGYTFKGIKAKKFIFDLNGKEVTLGGSQVTSIEPGFDTNRVVDRGGVQTISEGEEVDLKDFIETGVTTVVHFHTPEGPASVRQGGYLEVAADKSRGKIVVLRIAVPGLDAAVAKQHSIASLPQFWFYNSRGTLSRKLVDRFTEADIEAALKAAK